MKSFYQYMISTPLYAVVALLLCLGSCQSSDNAGAGEGASVSSLPLTAQIGDVSSRVSMSDAYDGVISCLWNKDKLNVYHKYFLESIVRGMTSLEFGTSLSAVPSATFSYAGGGSYCYNPGSRLYAFSKGTGGGYTASVADDGTSTLTAPTLTRQKGTLNDCATYDALYGSAVVDYNTGKPASLTMHHLFGMLNFHLMSTTFSKNYPVRVKFTSWAAYILPDNGGSATLNADGSLNQLTGSWGTSWQTTVTPTIDGVIDVYLMTWPFNATNGKLIVWCSDASGYVYTPLTVAVSGFSLAAAQIKSQSLAIVNAPFSYDSSKLFAWDATDYQPVTLNTAPTNANTIIGTGSYLNQASYACQNCPNANEITWYLSVPCYWDEGDIPGGNTTVYKLADGTTTTSGMWFRKRSGISGFSSDTSSGYESCSSIALTSDNVKSLNLTTNYFFLPVAGCAFAGSGAVYDGSTGFYWSSTPQPNAMHACYLNFYPSGASLLYFDRSCGLCLWQGQ